MSARGQRPLSGPRPRKSPCHMSAPCHNMLLPPSRARRGPLGKQGAGSLGGGGSGIDKAGPGTTATGQAPGEPPAGAGAMAEMTDEATARPRVAGGQLGSPGQWATAKRVPRARGLAAGAGAESCIDGEEALCNNIPSPCQGHCAWAPSPRNRHACPPARKRQAAASSHGNGQPPAQPATPPAVPTAEASVGRASILACAGHDAAGPWSSETRGGHCHLS